MVVWTSEKPEMPYTRVDMTRTSGLMNIRRWCAGYRNKVLVHCARAAENKEWWYVQDR